MPWSQKWAGGEWREQVTSHHFRILIPAQWGAHTFIELSIPNGQKEDAFPLRKLSEMAAELMLEELKQTQSKVFHRCENKRVRLRRWFLLVKSSLILSALASLVAQKVKNLPTMQEIRV